MEKNRALLISLYSLDPENQVFGHQKNVATDLASRFYPTYIVTNEDKSALDISGHGTTDVFSHKTDKKMKYLINSLWLVLRLYIRHKRQLVIFSFMTDYFSATVSFLTRILGIRHVLWYAHAKPSIFFKISEKLVDVIVSSTKESLPSNSHKCILIGQLVDSKNFAPHSSRTFDRPRKALYVGRLDPSKGVSQILGHIANICKEMPGFHLNVIGEPTSANKGYLAHLLLECKRLDIESMVTFLGVKSAVQINHYMNESDFLVHYFQGSLDKVLVEAALTKLPIITINRGFHREFKTQYPLPLSDDDLFHYEFTRFLQLSTHQRKALSDGRYQIALSKHTYGNWIRQISGIIEADHETSSHHN